MMQYSIETPIHKMFRYAEMMIFYCIPVLDYQSVSYPDQYLAMAQNFSLSG